MQVTLIAIDLAKNIFQVCGVNQAGKRVFNKQVKRASLLKFIIQYPGVTIAMEACSGSNYWGRLFQKHGFKVMLIPPQHVKPFVKGNKNDRNDAFAISEAAQRPNMICVEPRTVEQTEIIQVHRLYARKVDERTALVNQTRGFLSEFGIVLGQGKNVLKEALPALISDEENRLTASVRANLQDIYDEWLELDKRIAALDKKINQCALSNEDAKRLMKIKGVAEKTATAVIAHAGSGKAYKNGRHFSANLGLVPKEHSSGGKQVLGGITKRGNKYLRRLLVQGAWSVIRYAKDCDDKLSVWATKLIERRGKHKAALAVANKLARIIWSILFHKTDYVPA